MDQAYSLEGLLFLLFDLVLSCLATFFLISSALYFTYYFHLTFSLQPFLLTFSFSRNFCLLSQFSPDPLIICILYSRPNQPCLFIFHCIIFIPHPTCFFCPHSSILCFVLLCLLTCLSAAEGRLSICHCRLYGSRVKQVQEVRAHVNTSLRSERERTCLPGTGMPVSLSRENAPFGAILVRLISC